MIIIIYAYPNVMQASLDTCDLRSLTDSNKASSICLRLWPKQSYSAAPATTNARTFFSCNTNGMGRGETKVKKVRREYYIDIDRDGHEISCFGGVPRELYFPKGKYCPEGKYNYLGTTDT